MLPDGGSVARVDVVVARVYPLLYFERDNGRSGEWNERQTGGAKGVFFDDVCLRWYDSILSENGLFAVVGTIIIIFLDGLSTHQLQRSYSVAISFDVGKVFGELNCSLLRDSAGP